MLKRFIKRAATGLGLDIHRKEPLNSEAALLNALGKARVNLAIDVGANEGQFASYLRELGYKGRIISYEPLSSAYRTLKRAASKDGKIEARNKALGDRDGEISMNVSQNSVSSSIMPLSRSLRKDAPDSAYSSVETAKIAKLDSEFPKADLDGKRVFLKIDVQGYEPFVLDGGRRFLQSVQVLEVEMSFVPLYTGQALFGELYGRILGMGFECIDIFPVFRGKDSRLLSVDGVFVRKR